MMSRQRKGKENEAVHGVGTFGKIVSYVVMILVCFISLFPVIWVAISSLKADPLAEPGFTLPSALCFDGYIGVFRDMHIMRYFFNSFKVAGISVVLSIIMISMSAYVVARMNFKFKSVVSVMLMSTLFIPPTAMTFPVYNLINSMGINDTHAGLILIYTCSGIAVSFMVIKNYFLTIPVELEEAARIDGCGYTQTFFKIMLPIARPGILTAAMLLGQTGAVWAEATDTASESPTPTPDPHTEYYAQAADTDSIEGWPEGPKIEAQSAVLMDLNTEAVLYSKNANTQLYPASITKLLTCLLGCENLDVNAQLTLSQQAAYGIEAGSSTIYGDAGEIFTVEQCLMALMLESANEMALGIGEEVSGSVKKFVELMNTRAQQLGCKNTHFNNLTDFLMRLM